MLFLCFVAYQPLLENIVTVATDLISRYMRRDLYLVYKVVFQVIAFVLIAQTEKC